MRCAHVGGKVVKEAQNVFRGSYHAYSTVWDEYYRAVAGGTDFQYDGNGLQS